MKQLALVCPLALAVGCAATSETAPEPPAAPEAVAMPKAMYPGDEPVDQVAEAPTDEPDIICRWVRPTGSRIKKKHCTTRKQREEMRKNARDFYERARTPDPTAGEPGL